jgi:hypothetical protein
MRRTTLAIATIAIATLAIPAAAQAQNGAPPGHDDVTAHPGPGRRLVCLDGVRQLYLTPDEEDIPGNAPVPGPCPGQAPPTSSPEIVTLCIQGVTTTGPKGSANPTGHLYPEGPCPGPTPPAAVKARPRFTG